MRGANGYLCQSLLGTPRPREGDQTQTSKGVARRNQQRQESDRAGPSHREQHREREPAQRAHEHEPSTRGLHDRAPACSPTPTASRPDNSDKAEVALEPGAAARSAVQVRRRVVVRRGKRERERKHGSDQRTPAVGGEGYVRQLGEALLTGGAALETGALLVVGAECWRSMARHPKHRRSESGRLLR